MRMKKLITAALALCMLAALPFAACEPAYAEGEITKVLATTSYTPVALMDVSFISASTSTDGCYATSITWYDQNYTVLTDKFGTDTLHLEIRLDAYEGRYFAEDLRAYLNNSEVDYAIGEGGSFIILRRDYTPEVWLPTVIKHPGAETITEGSWASFVATATYCNGYTWSLVDPSGRSIACADIASKFPNVTVAGDGTEKILVRNIPLEMNGWKAVCTFSGPGGSVTSNGALITVNPDPAKATPTPTKTPEPSAQPEESPEPTEEVHSHEFSDTWESDAGHHWRKCACGEMTDRGEHTMEWTELRPAEKNFPGEERGTCSVCGYTTSRELQYKGDDDAQSSNLSKSVDLSTFRIIMFVIMGALVIGVVALIIRGAVENKRRRH